MYQATREWGGYLWPVLRRLSVMGGRIRQERALHTTMNAKLRYYPLRLLRSWCRGINKTSILSLVLLNACPTDALEYYISVVYKGYSFNYLYIC